MSEIDAAMDRYETAARGKGYEIKADEPSFDEVSARAALAHLGVAINPEYFALLRRWNGAELVGFKKDDDEEGYFGLQWSYPSFSESLDLYQLLRDLDESEGAGEPESPHKYFNIFTDIGGDKLGYRIKDDSSCLYLTLRDAHGAVLKYRGLAAAINTFAAAIEAGLTFSGDMRSRRREQIDYARIAKRFNPDVASWDEEIAYWTEELKREP